MVLLLNVKYYTVSSDCRYIAYQAEFKYLLFEMTVLLALMGEILQALRRNKHSGTMRQREISWQRLRRILAEWDQQNSMFFQHEANLQVSMQISTSGI